MVEYRPVPEDDTDAFRDVLDYAFRPEAGPSPEREEDPPLLAERRGLYEAGELVTAGAHYAFEVSIRGRWLEVAGLSAVATRPEHRHRGLVRRLLAESLREYRGWDQPVALLWPFKHAFYRRFGWGRLGGYGRYELEPDALAGVEDHPLAGGTVDPLDADDHDALRALDDRFASRHDLAMRRTEEWYRHRFFEGWQDDPYVFGWWSDGELGGYLRYHVTKEDGDRTLRVIEFGAPDHRAAINLLGFLRGHADQVDTLAIIAPLDELVLDLVDDPGAVEVTYVPGAMGRLVDVAAGLEALPAPDDVETSVVLDVTDDLCDWNDRPFVLEAAAGAIAVERSDGDGPRAAMPVDTLSRLALGTTTVERAAVGGDLEADETARSRLAALFPTREVFLREFF